MSKLNHQRPRFRLQGKIVETIGDDDMPVAARPAPRKPPPSKAALRTAAGAALEDFKACGGRVLASRIVRCGCGHVATVQIPRERQNARLRCSKCGEIAT